MKVVIITFLYAFSLVSHVIVKTVLVERVPLTKKAPQLSSGNTAEFIEAVVTLSPVESKL